MSETYLNTPRKHAKAHQALVNLAHRLPQDYAPWGQHDRDALPPEQWTWDCSSGCKHALWLPPPLGGDWCVCTNAASHRCGLLTFEHQGCPHFESGRNRWDGHDD